MLHFLALSFPAGLFVQSVTSVLHQVTIRNPRHILGLLHQNVLLMNDFQCLLLIYSTLVNLLCQLFIKYECKQTPEVQTGKFLQTSLSYVYFLLVLHSFIPFY